VSALAGVTADGVGQPRYPEQRLQERPAKDAPAVFATRRIVPEGPEFVRLAERADEELRAGGEGVFHLLVLSDLSGLTPLIMPDGFEYDIAQMSDFLLIYLGEFYLANLE
jgi:hypothetical protein